MSLARARAQAPGWGTIKRRLSVVGLAVLLFRVPFPGQTSRPSNIRYRDNSQFLDSGGGQKCTMCEHARADASPGTYARQKYIATSPARIARSISISDFNLMPSRYLRQDLPIPISCYRTFRDAPPRFLTSRARSRRTPRVLPRPRGVGVARNRKSSHLLSLSLSISACVHRAHEYSRTITNISMFSLFVSSAAAKDHNHRREADHARLKGRAVRGGPEAAPFLRRPRR